MDVAPILYNEFPLFLKRYFPYKVQKISLNAGFTCPNRDGVKGYGGCTYCNNQTFNPEYCRTEKSVTQQLEEGKVFFAHKYPEMKYLAYFQAYTNTYGELEALKRKYEEALSVSDVVGLVIGTRPDCMPDTLLHYLEEVNKNTFLLVEYGIESTHDATLRRINRGHTFQDTVDAVIMVYAPVELRIQRAMYRDGASEEQVRARIAAQMDDEEKRRRADFTVVNDGVQLLIPQLNRIVEQLKTEKFIL